MVVWAFTVLTVFWVPFFYSFAFLWHPLVSCLRAALPQHIA